MCKASSAPSGVGRQRASAAGLDSIRAVLLMAAPARSARPAAQLIDAAGDPPDGAVPAAAQDARRHGGANAARADHGNRWLEREAVVTTVAEFGEGEGPGGRDVAVVPFGRIADIDQRETPIPDLRQHAIGRKRVRGSHEQPGVSPGEWIGDRESGQVPDAGGTKQFRAFAAGLDRRRDEHDWLRTGRPAGSGAESAAAGGQVYRALEMTAIEALRVSDVEHADALLQSSGERGRVELRERFGVRRALQIEPNHALDVGGSCRDPSSELGGERDRVAKREERVAAPLVPDRR